MSTQQWNPREHPRMANGTFARKGAGSFSYGTVKNATYRSPGKASKGIHYHIGPGGAAYAASSGSVFARAADGTWVVYRADGSQQQYGASGTFEGMVGKALRLLAEQPGIEVPARSLTEAEAARTHKVRIGSSVTMAQLALLPVNTVITAGKVTGVRKHRDGWHLPKTGAIIKTWKTDVKPLRVTEIGDEHLLEDV